MRVILGIQMYGSDRFEDYQSIYEETMKRAEKQGSEYEHGYDDKKWERGRGRWCSTLSCSLRNWLRGNLLLSKKYWEIERIIDKIEEK